MTHVLDICEIMGECLSANRYILSKRSLVSAVSVEWWDLKADWNGLERLLLDLCADSCNSF